MSSLLKLNTLSKQFALNILSKNKSSKSKRKLNKVSSTISGLIVSLIDQDENVVNHLEKVYNLYTDDQLMVNDIYSVSSLEDMWPEQYRHIASQIINTPCQGLGTPNAASGCGELFLLMTSPKFTSPTKGDIQYLDKKIEIKMGGKLDSLPVSGKEVNNAVVAFVKNQLGKYNILPECTRGSNKGKKQFLLSQDKEDIKRFLSNLSDKEKDLVIRKWFDSQKLNCILPESKKYLAWDDIKSDWLHAVLKYEFDNSGFDVICVLEQSENFTFSKIFQNYNVFHDYLISRLNVESRAFQKNKISPYLGSSYDK